MLGMLRSCRLSGSPALATKSAAVSLMVSVGDSARLARMLPAPRSKTPALLPSTLVTAWSDDVMSADFT